MTTKTALITNSVAILIGAPSGALIAKYATAWVAGFKPRYFKALISTTITYAIVFVIGSIFQLTGRIRDYPRGLQMITGFLVLSFCHFILLRSDSGQRLSQGKALLVAICQIAGVLIAMIVALFLAIGLKQLFT